jgi:hypothetical protein
MISITQPQSRLTLKTDGKLTFGQNIPEAKTRSNALLGIVQKAVIDLGRHPQILVLT